MTPYDLRIEPGLPLVCPAFTLEGLKVREQNPALEEALAALSAELRALWHATSIGDVPGIQPVRASYHALGLDPTRYRPSSEALLRRVLKGQNLYRINTLVDALNYASLKYLVPFGLYDLDQVRPPVALRVGKEGEGYPGIRKEFVSVAGRACLTDEIGPFGNPSSDSDRTKITPATTRALVAPFLPRETSAERAREIAAGTAEALLRYV